MTCPFYAENERLKEELRQLKALLQPTALPEFPEEWKLSAPHKRVIASLLSSPTYSRTSAQLLAVSVKFAESASSHVHQTYISQIRRKTGLKINFDYETGYYLPPETVESLKRAVSPSRLT